MAWPLYPFVAVTRYLQYPKQRQLGVKRASTPGPFQVQGHSLPVFRFVSDASAWVSLLLLHGGGALHLSSPSLPGCLSTLPLTQLSLFSEDKIMPDKRGDFVAGQSWFGFSDVILPWSEFQGMGDDPTICPANKTDGGRSAHHFRGKEGPGRLRDIVDWLQSWEAKAPGIKFRMFRGVSHRLAPISVGSRRSRRAGISGIIVLVMGERCLQILNSL